MGFAVLLLTTDAYGGHGGIALYNRDIAEALAAMPQVAEVAVIPRNMLLPPEPPQEGPAPARRQQGRQSIGTAVEACKDYDLVICGHIKRPRSVVISSSVRPRPRGVRNRRWQSPTAAKQ
jgi:hypothetical protein